MTTDGVLAAFRVHQTTLIVEWRRQLMAGWLSDDGLLDVRAQLRSSLFDGMRPAASVLLRDVVLVIMARRGLTTWPDPSEFVPIPDDVSSLTEPPDVAG